jgi:hypothetical protein
MVFKVACAADSLAVILARSKFGIAIAANKAMIATTIIISTRVKPRFMVRTPLSKVKPDPRLFCRLF